MENTERKEINTQQLRDFLARQHRDLKSVEDGLAMSDKLLGLEQLFTETGARVKAIQDSEGAWTQKKLDALAAAEEAQKTAGGIIKAANEDAKKIAEEARALASRVVSEAKERAKGLQDGAKNSLQAASEKTEQLAKVNDGLADQIKAKKLELDEVQAALSQSKAGLEKFLKG